MSIDVGGWLNAARRVHSPNCDARPSGYVVDLVVVHCISLPRGCYLTGDIEALFSNQLDCARDPSYADLEGLHVSAHVLIDRQGKPTQFVSFEERAWHAGTSAFEGRSACNDFSVGIELEGVDDGPFEHLQYETLVSILEALHQRWPEITPRRVVGHSDIAPGRKTDPGSGFDWKRARAGWGQRT